MLISSFVQDLQYGLRIFRTNSGFYSILVVVLALGIGGTTAMFTVIHGVILQPLPFKDSGQLMVIGAPAPPNGETLRWWGQSQAFTDLCEYRSGGVNLTEGDWPTRVPAATVSASFFSVFSVVPQLGRAFVVEDELAGRNRVAILSSNLWLRNFDGDREIVGTNIRLNGVSHIIVGVMPPSFSYPGRTDIWVPKASGAAALELGEIEQADLPPLLNGNMIGRMRSEGSVAQARSDLLSLFNRFQETYVQSHMNFGSGVQVVPLQEAVTRNFRPALLALFAGVGFLLLVSCANAANLLLARAATRQREVAVRLCLGASVWRITRQLLTENILLGFAGGSVGVLVSFWAIGLIRRFGPRDVPRLADVHINSTVLGFSVLLSLLVGVAVGILPALQAFVRNLTESLKEGGARSARGFRQRTRRGLVIIQVAVALMLVMGAGITMRSFFKLEETAPGFNPGNILTMSISLPKAEYDEPVENQRVQTASPEGSKKSIGSVVPSTLVSKEKSNNTHRVASFHADLFEHIRGLPGVVAAGGVTQLPLGSSNVGKLWVDVTGSSGGLAIYSYADGDYFGAMRIPLLEGRPFVEKDTESAPRVVIVNEALAQLFWDGRSPISQQLTIGGESGSREVIGVVKDIKQVGLSKEAEPQFYLPHFQPLRTGRPPLNMTLVVRTDGDPRAILGSLRGVVLSLDPNLPVFRVRTMTETVSESISGYRFRGFLFTSFALIAYVLAGVGVYGVLSYSVASRRNEIGVRMSLGAGPQDIALLVIREGALLAVLGVGLGSVSSLGLNRFISNLLYGVQPTDVPTLLVSVIVILAGALLACLVPALAATRVEPVAALRCE